MLKTGSKRLLTVFYCLISCTFFLHFQTLSAYAATPQVSLGGNTIGRPGKAVTITGSDFAPATPIKLFVVSAPAQCNATGAGLTPFATNPTVTTDAGGAFTVSTTWPANAAIATTPYYICANNGTDVQAVSPDSFTIAQPAAIVVTPGSVEAGQQLVITGTDWTPQQSLTLSVSPKGVANYITSEHVTPDNNGKFTFTVNVPANTAPGIYTVSAIDDNDPNTKATKDVTVTAKATPTPTPTTEPTPTPTATEEPTATAEATPTTPPTSAANNNDTTGGGTSPTTVLIVTLGGIGMLLVIIGGVMFAVYSRPGVS